MQKHGIVDLFLKMKSAMAAISFPKCDYRKVSSERKTLVHSCRLFSIEPPCRSSRRSIPEMEVNQSDHANSDSLSASIREELSKLPPLSPNRCIYRIPERLRQANEHAYTPIVVSIGPYHHKNEKLMPMELQKIRYLDRFLDDRNKYADIDTLLRIVKDSESKIRECYADATMFKLSSDEFNRMVLVDSIFIIMIFQRYKDTFIRDDDKIYRKPFKNMDVFRDIMLAENQLPFFILNALYKIAFRPDENKIPSFIDIACDILEVNKSKITINPETRETACCHLLHLLQTHYLPSELRENLLKSDKAGETKEKQQNGGRTITCANINSLHEAGIKFRATESSFGRLLDIRFEKDKGILTIPKLRVGYETEYEFRNLIAFEQCHNVLHDCISDYIFLMDCLISTPSDVELLVKAGVIDNWLGSNKEVSNLFNSLDKNVFTCPEKYKFGGLAEELNSYCKQPWNHHRAILKHTYFRHPWAAMSVLYAAILLILTLIQVVIDIIPLV